MAKTIIVSNRLPVKVEKNAGKFTFQQSEGGLATGLKAIFSENDIWIGWPGVTLNEEKEEKTVAKKLLESRLHPIFLSQKMVDGFYYGFANDTIWPLFHYFPSYSDFAEKNWKIYQLVNQIFADEVIKIAAPGDTIWIHDYHLLLLPELIRKELPDVSIGFFQHIPFPSFEIFRLLPWRKEILQGMLGADLIGFHTMDDVNHFLESTGRLAGCKLDANTVYFHQQVSVVDAFPMGIDFEKFDRLTEAPKTLEYLREIKQSNTVNAAIILSIDRLDYSKGILSRLHALEFIFRTKPEWREKFTLFMLIVPSRDTVPEYKRLKDEMDKITGSINGKYRTLNWQPIQYFYRSLPIEYLSALYQSAKVCLVTPMRDGMNLVSKEYVASRRDNTGVLVLSEMAGASRELNNALLVNPNDNRQIAEAVVEAIRMPIEEQQKRMKQMRGLVQKFDIHHWVKIFMEKLKEVKDFQHSLHTKHIDAQLPSFQNAYRQARERCLFLDYDGTLVGFNTDIEKAFPDKELYKIIDGLRADSKNHVVIISGRNYETLEKWFGHLNNVDLIAEHGVWAKYGRNDWEKTEGISDQWKPLVLPRLEIITDRTPGSFMEEKSNSLVWHYRNADLQLGELRSGEIVSQLGFLTASNGLQIMFGDKVVEIKSMEINKGKAINKWFAHTGVQSDINIAIGDDYTDEDIFKTLTDSKDFTIKVGQKISAAKYYLQDYLEVRRFLKVIIELAKK